MKPEQQRIAIAEACGFVAHYSWMKGTDAAHIAEKGIWRYGSGMHYFGTLPDYLNDLNAMHEAEKTITGTQQDTFRDELKEVCFRDWHGGKKPRIHAEFATAAQRAEAFLRAIGKWTP